MSYHSTPPDGRGSSGAEGDRERHDAALAQVRAALVGLRYGVVTIVVQDGVVVQMERTEKTRLTRAR